MRRLIKAVVPPLVILLVVGLLVGFAYFSQNPESPALEEAQEWPVVGHVARFFRETYRPLEDAGEEQTESTTEVEIVYLTPDGKRLTKEQTAGEEPIRLASGAEPPRSRRPSDTPDWPRTSKTPNEPVPVKVPEETLTSRVVPGESPTDDSDRRSRRSNRAERAPSSAAAVVARERASYLVSGWSWFLPGNTVRAEARSDAAARIELASMAWLPVLDRKGSWAEVVYDGQRGWVDTAWEPPYPRKAARRGLLRHRHEPVRSTDWGDLVEARKVLGIKEPTAKLGAYDLLTDVEDPQLIEFLDTAATAAEEAYFARFGRLPSGDPGRTAVLFATREKYLEYSSSTNMVTNTHMGHARTGLLAFFAEGISRERLGRTFIHEIGHLLNDRALARNLPTWLEEGLATDLGSVWIEDSPLVTGRSSRRFIDQGPDGRLLVLADIAKKTGGLPPVSVLMSLDYETFHKEGDIESYAYSHSVGLVRYLLDGDDGRHAKGFRAFLKDIATGYGASPKLLVKRLGVELEELDRDFRVWLAQELEAARSRRNQRLQRLAAR